MQNSEMTLIEQAYSGRRTTNPFVACLLAPSFVILGGILSFSKHSFVSMFVLIGGMLFFWITQYERRDFKTLLLRINKQRSLSLYSQGLLFGFFLCSLLFITYSVLGYAHFSYSSRLNAFSLFNIFGMLLVFGIQSGVEELVFRGWLMPILSGAWGVSLGVLISSLIF